MPFILTKKEIFHRQGYEKQIKEMEISSEEMQSKFKAAQHERDTARLEAAQLLAQKEDQEKDLTDLLRLKEELKEEASMHKDTISNMKVELEAEKNKAQALSETVNTLQNNILNLQKQVEGLNETCSKLACDLEAESKLRINTQTQLTQVQQLNQHLEQQNTAGEVKVHQLKREKEELYAELQSKISELASIKRPVDENVSSHANLTDPPVDRNVIVEQLAEKTPTKTEQRAKGDEVTRLKAVLGARDEDLSRSRLVIKDLEERLRQVSFTSFIIV